MTNLFVVVDNKGARKAADYPVATYAGATRRRMWFESNAKFIRSLNSVSSSSIKSAVLKY